MDRASFRVRRFAAHIGGDAESNNKHQILEIQKCGNEGPVPQDVASLPLPPVCKAENGIFPTFPEMLKHYKEVGGVFSYEIIGGRRITIIADDSLYDVVFSPDEMGSTPGVEDAIKVEMDKLAHAWFGIPFPIVEQTKPSLAAVRKCIGPLNVQEFVDKVGVGVQELFDGYKEGSVMDLVDVAHGTFWPVNQAMFGKETISKELTPDAPKWFHSFDEYIPAVTGGMPATMFDEMQNAAKSIVKMFQDSIEKGNDMNKTGCPVLHDRFEPFDRTQFPTADRAAFMISLFWAPQANTLPMTFWMLAHILTDPRVKKKVEEEARTSYKDVNGPDFPYGEAKLPYIEACMRETLRLYIANLTHRHVSRDVPVRRKDGTWLKIPHKDMLSVASYTRHYDPDIYANPHEFRPERWLGEENHQLKDYWPFALGKYSCSGKFLAQGEMPVLAALFFRDFDTEVEGGKPLPTADWERVVASVRPEGWPYDVGFNVKIKSSPLRKRRLGLK